MHDLTDGIKAARLDFTADELFELGRKMNVQRLSSCHIGLLFWSVAGRGGNVNAPRRIGRAPANVRQVDRGAARRARPVVDIERRYTISSAFRSESAGNGVVGNAWYQYATEQM